MFIFTFVWKYNDDKGYYWEELKMKPLRRISSDDQPLKRFKNELDGMFQRFFDDPFFSNKSLGNKDGLTPACNIAEKKDRYTIEVEVPGVDPEKIEVEIDGKMMRIKGERRKETELEDSETQMHTIEHSYGSFFRSFTLPDDINADEISADNKNGILYIDIPKNMENKTRKIQIRNSNNE